MARAKARPMTGWGVVLLFGMLLTFMGMVVLADDARLWWFGRQAVATVVDVTAWKNRAGQQRYTYTFRYRDQAGAEQPGWVMVPDERYTIGQKVTVTYLDGWSRANGTEEPPWVWAALGLGLMGVAAGMRVMGIGTAPLWER